jgi:16S rRNA (guanine1207-N2)-methyltransferase
LLSALPQRIAAPVAIALGSPRQAATLAAAVGADVTCYQMDLHQADRLQEVLAQQSCSARVASAADLWDLPAEFQTILYPAPSGGERSLKIDMIEQAYHVLKPRGTLVVLSPYPNDPFFPELLKKTFGRAHAPAVGHGQVIWAQRHEDRPRRRHEMSFRATVAGDGPLPFLSRPGTFSYGRLDLGARALLETAVVHPGDRILDLGCGCGTNGVFVGRRSGPDGHVTFVDSNLRAIALSEHNARTNGLVNFEAVATSTLQGLPPSFDVILANPPYYAQNAVARLFVERSAALLSPKGRFYLVTKQADAVAPFLTEAFGYVEVFIVRGYSVFFADNAHGGLTPRRSP